MVEYSCHMKPEGEPQAVLRIARRFMAVHICRAQRERAYSVSGEMGSGATAHGNAVVFFVSFGSQSSLPQC